MIFIFAKASRETEFFVYFQKFYQEFLWHMDLWLAFNHKVHLMRIQK